MPKTVAIVGRPNVGKSTLFNRLVGSRRAIVDDRPGVTRDRLEGEARLFGLSFRVVDTAGLLLDTGSAFEEALKRQTLRALAEADLALFLIDARAGITPLDEEIAELLRRSGRPVLLVANKCEGRLPEAQAAEAWALGLGAPLPLSAEHGLGFDELAEALAPLIVEDEDSAAGAQAEGGQSDGAIRIAVVGRPNTGKSSLVNRLIGEERLLVGPEAGITRDAVDVAWQWRGQPFILVDTAGLRKRARIEDRVEKISASASLKAIRSCDVAVLVVDALQALEKQDVTIAARALSQGRPLVVALNKWDLVREAAAVRRAVTDRARERLSDVPAVPLVPVSALTGFGLDRLLQAVLDVHARAGERIGTGRLNRWLEQALTRHPPPSVDGRRTKIRFATQTAVRPPTLVLFGNRPAQELPASYRRYLLHDFRKTFGLEGIPVRLELRAGDNPFD